VAGERKGDGVSEISAQLRWKGEGLLFEGTSHRGSVQLSGADDPPGSGPSPSELLIMAAGACTGMDVVAILRKMRQPLEAFAVEVHALKADDHPRRVESIEVVYRLRGDLSEARVQRAIELSETRYCAVEATLRGSVSITSRYLIEP